MAPLHHTSSLYSVTKKSPFDSSMSLGHALPSYAVSPDIEKSVKRESSFTDSLSAVGSRETRWSDFLEDVVVIPAPRDSERDSFVIDVRCGELVTRPDTAFHPGDCAGWN